MKIKSISRTMKLAILGIGLSFLTNAVKSQTFRIQEHSVNPNCGGRYELYLNGASISNTYTYSYPNNINNTYPSVPPPPAPAPACINAPLPNQIKFTVPNCGGSPFFINITGAATTKICNCTGTLANHNFSATIQPDPINQCDYLLDIYY